jgi:hypothetical protein
VACPSGRYPRDVPDPSGPGWCSPHRPGPFPFVPAQAPLRKEPVHHDRPARVTAAEIADLLNHARRLMAEDASLADQIAYHERKALLLSRIAVHLDTAEAHQVAADAWHYAGQLARQRDQQEVRP